MHEVSLVDALFDQVDRARGDYASGSVREVSVRVGERAGIETELLETAFVGLRSSRGYGGAELRLTRALGRDLVLERIELEVSDV